MFGSSLRAGLQRFVDKVVIVTGSSSGIGRDAALAFAREGASVVLHGQNVERINKTEEMIRTMGVAHDRVLKVEGAMEHERTQSELVRRTVERFGKIDVLVNNHGAGNKPGNSNPVSLEYLDYMYHVNFRSVVNLTQLAFPYLAKTRGNVVNVSSVVSQRPLPYGTFYAALKAALNVWSGGYAQYYGPKGVRINSVLPGLVETYMFERDHDSTQASYNDAAKFMQEWIKEASVLQRMGKTHEITSIILFLASDDASYMTGTNLVADGGYLNIAPKSPWNQFATRVAEQKQSATTPPPQQQTKSSSKNDKNDDASSSSQITENEARAGVAAAAPRQRSLASAVASALSVTASANKTTRNENDADEGEDDERAAEAWKWQQASAALSGINIASGGGGGWLAFFENDENHAESDYPSTNFLNLSSAV